MGLSLVHEVSGSGSLPLPSLPTGSVIDDEVPPLDGNPNPITAQNEYSIARRE